MELGPHNCGKITIVPEADSRNDLGVDWRDGIGLYGLKWAVKHGILTAEEYAKAKADLDRCGRRSEAKEVAPLRLLELLAQPPTGRERLLSLVFFSVQPESSDGNVLGAT
jgi:hypothetical protein